MIVLGHLSTMGCSMPPCLLWPNDATVGRQKGGHLLDCCSNQRSSFSRAIDAFDSVDIRARIFLTEHGLHHFFETWGVRSGSENIRIGSVLHRLIYPEICNKGIHPRRLCIFESSQCSPWWRRVQPRPSVLLVWRPCHIPSWWARGRQPWNQRS